MEHFDTVITLFFNEFSQRSWTFDRIVSFIVNIDFFKGGIIVAIYWAFWFSPTKENIVDKTRKSIIANYAGVFVALFLARVLAQILPFRLRPLHNPALHFRPPFGVSELDLGGWSSFPSDHATMFFGLAFGILLISRRFGIFSIMYVLSVILIPRIYCGYHYTTDIIGGGLLGIICVMAANMPYAKRFIADPLLGLSEKYPRCFYGTFFLFSYELSDLFDHLRRTGTFSLGIFHALIRQVY